MYVGQIDEQNLPHGEGFLLLTDGSQHYGQFKKGRADGTGILQMPNGTVVKGEWEDNRRCGVFSVVDAHGTKWMEKYNRDGKKIARKRSQP